jgi:hypothetical protein
MVTSVVLLPFVVQRFENLGLSYFCRYFTDNIFYLGSVMSFFIFIIEIGHQGCFRNPFVTYLWNCPKINKEESLNKITCVTKF